MFSEYKPKLNYSETIYLMNYSFTSPSEYGIWSIKTQLFFPVQYKYLGTLRQMSARRKSLLHLTEIGA